MSTRAPRVVVACDWFLRQASRQAAGLVAAGAEVVLLCVRDAAEFSGDHDERDAFVRAARDRGVIVAELPPGRGDPRTLPDVVRTWERLRRWRPDVAQVHWNYEPRLFLCTLGTPLALTVHDPNPHPGQTPLHRDHRLLMRAWFRRARVIVVHGENLRAPAEGLVDPRRVEVVPLGVDVAPAALPVPATPTVLLFGRLEPYKGISVLADAMERVWRERPDVRLLVAGDGPERGAVPEGPQVERRLGYIPETEVEGLFAAASVCVLPYTEASQTGVGLEAIARGVPVVVSDVGALPEIAMNAESVVPPADPDLLARALLGALSVSAQERATLRDWADQRFSWAAVGGRMLQMYRRRGLTGPEVRAR